MLTQEEFKKVKRAEQKAKWYQDNKVKMDKYHEDYRLINKENISKANKEYYGDNKEDLVKSSLDYYHENKSDILIKRADYYEANKDTINHKQKTYRDDNKEKIKVRQKNYVKRKKNEDPLYKLKHTIRVSIGNSLKKKKVNKISKTTIILGCSFDELKLYLEAKFQSWMSWDNHGKYNGTEGYGWDIDHIIPLSSAMCEEDIIRLNHYTNLQPLCSKVNRDIKRGIKHTL